MPPPPLFRILTTAASSVTSTISTSNAVFTDEVIGRTAVPRLGSLALPGRKVVATPAFFAVTSRGAVPHVTPDNFARTDLVDGAYFALEDCKWLLLSYSNFIQARTYRQSSRASPYAPAASRPSSRPQLHHQIQIWFWPLLLLYPDYMRSPVYPPPLYPSSHLEDTPLQPHISATALVTSLSSPRRASRS